MPQPSSEMNNVSRLKLVTDKQNFKSICMSVLNNPFKAKWKKYFTSKSLIILIILSTSVLSFCQLQKVCNFYIFWVDLLPQLQHDDTTHNLICELYVEPGQKSIRDTLFCKNSKQLEPVNRFRQTANQDVWYEYLSLIVL